MTRFETKNSSYINSIETTHSWFRIENDNLVRKIWGVNWDGKEREIDPEKLRCCTNTGKKEIQKPELLLILNGNSDKYVSK